MAADAPRPSSPEGLVVGPGGTLYGRWRVMRVRTLTKYLATVCVGMLLLVGLSLNSQMVRECIYSDQEQPTVLPAITVKTFTRRELRELYTRRRDTMEEVCSRNGISPERQNFKPAKFRHIYVDDKHKFLWCSVPKVACTNFKRILLVLSGKVNTTDPAKLASSDVHSTLERHLKTLDRFSPKEIRQRLRDYYKFMFVRDPMERILSAYVNKFTMNYNKRFHIRYGTKIIKHFRRKPSKEAIRNGDDVTFEEFIRYLLNSSISEPFNEHWLQYYKLCAPCLVQYDTIGKYETMNADVDFVLEDLKIKDLVSFPKGTAQDGKGKTTRIVTNYYKSLSSELIHKLWELYSVDYSMFGYPYPDVYAEEE